MMPTEIKHSVAQESCLSEPMVILLRSRSRMENIFKNVGFKPLIMYIDNGFSKIISEAAASHYKINSVQYLLNT